MTTQTEHDPVCHMDIAAATAAGRSDFEGLTYYFCSRGCKLEFDDDPAVALKGEAEYDHSQPMAHMMSEPGSAAKKPWWRFW